MQKRVSVQENFTKTKRKINLNQLEEVLAGKKSDVRGPRLLDRLIGSSKKQAKCEICGLTEWRNIPNYKVFKKNFIIKMVILLIIN